MTVEATIVGCCYEIHGVTVMVSSAEPSVIEALDLRLRDFRTDGGLDDPDVRFEFESGGRKPSPPGGGCRPVYDTPYGSLYYYPETDTLWGELAGTSLRCEPSRGVATLHATELTGRSLYLATHPLATISLMELLERRGLYSLHAACLANQEGAGVLLAGPSGAGKSTLALALARAGMTFLSDDLVFLAREAGKPVRVLGFADAVGVTDRTAEQFVELRDGPAAAGFPKRLRRIEDLFGAPASSTCVPTALIFPQVAADRPSALGLLDGKEAMLRLVPDVLLTEAAATHSHLAAIAGLIGQVRCYTLVSGTDLERAVDLISDLP